MARANRLPVTPPVAIHSVSRGNTAQHLAFRTNWMQGAVGPTRRAQTILQRRVFGSAVRCCDISRPVATRDGQVLPPGAGLLLHRAGRRRPLGARAFQRALSLRHVRPGAGEARLRPRGKLAARAPGDRDRAALSRPHIEAIPDWRNA